MKKLLTLVLTVLMALSCCVIASAEEEHPNWLCDEKTTLTVLVQPTSKMVDITTNEFTQWLEDQTNVHIEWTVLESDAKETVSLMLSSGETLPDICMVNLTAEQSALYGANGVLIPLNDLFAQYAPNIMKCFEDNPAYAASSYSADGNCYYITAYEDCYHCSSSQKMWINKQWLDNLGLEVPTTTEEFKNMLIAFRDQDANGNGDANDEIPFSTFYDGWRTKMEAFLMCAFIYDDGVDRLYVEDGVVKPTYTEEAFREGLKYVHDLYAEGLLDANGFVQDDAALKNLTSGEYVQVGAVCAGHTGMFNNTDNPNIFQWIALEPLVGPEGVQLAGYYPNVAKEMDGAGISSFCKNPELAAKWLDFLFTEEATISTQYGIKDVHWAYNDDPELLGLNDEKALFHTFGKAPEYTSTQIYTCWEHTSPYNWAGYIFAGQAVLGGDGYDLEKVLYDATKLYTPHIPEQICANLVYTDEQAAYVASNQTMLNNYVEQMISEFILGTSDINDDATWNGYIQTLKSMDLDNYISIMQSAYDTQQATLAALTK